MIVGVGARRVRELFAEARKVAPAIVFIDEIDSIGRSRPASGVAGGNDEREQTLNQILTEMDGFAATEDVAVIAATNRADVLDAALTRPGRFDRTITVHAPDRAGRAAILAVHTRSVPLGTGVDLEQLARATPGMTGAELANLVNEAALAAARAGAPHVTQHGLEAALPPDGSGAQPAASTALLAHESLDDEVIAAAGLPAREVVDTVTPSRIDTLPQRPRTTGASPAGAPVEREDGARTALSGRSAAHRDTEGVAPIQVRGPAGGEEVP